MPAIEPDYRAFGFQPNVVEVYRHAPRKGEMTPLTLHVYQPDKAEHPGPDRGLLVWFHSGGFRTGRLVHANHRALARRMNEAGITLAIPQYRLGAGRADLEKTTRGRMGALAAMAHEDFPGRFRRGAALAALEDGAAALAWLQARRGELGLPDSPMVLGAARPGR